MFERYDEPARRTLFFARYEASRMGVPSIETEHLLLGLIREPRGHAGRLLLNLPLGDIRRELESRRAHEKLPLRVEIPFSAEAKRVLEYACEEADALTHRHIGPEHLLLGLIRESGSRAATTLAQHGMRLESTREQTRDSSLAPAAKPVPRIAAQIQLEQIIESTRQLQLAMGRYGNFEAAQLVAELLLDLETLKSLLDEQQ
jgi:ATP-dependent Clp protease ATP-binding subunit ClpC